MQLEVGLDGDSESTRAHQSPGRTSSDSILFAHQIVFVFSEGDMIDSEDAEAVTLARQQLSSQLLTRLRADRCAEFVFF